MTEMAAELLIKKERKDNAAKWYKLVAAPKTFKTDEQDTEESWWLQRMWGRNGEHMHQRELKSE